MENSPVQLQKEIDGVYSERNALVAFLAAVYPSGIKKTEILGWDPSWHNCIYVDLPTYEATPDLGGKARSFIQTCRTGVNKGQERGAIILSNCDAALGEYFWNDNGMGYWKGHSPGPNDYLHRLVAERIWGSIPKGFEIDHIDRNPSNNVRWNLRLATHQGNNFNKESRCVEQRGKTWRAWKPGKPRVHLGTFKTEKEAITAVEFAKNQLIVELHKEGHYIYPPVQCSWHIHDSEMELFQHLPPYTKEWDGHDTKTKYERLERLTQRVFTSRLFAEKMTSDII